MKYTTSLKIIGKCFSYSPLCLVDERINLHKLYHITIKVFFVESNIFPYMFFVFMPMWKTVDLWASH